MSNEFLIRQVEAFLAGEPVPVFDPELVDAMLHDDVVPWTFADEEEDGK